KPEHVVPAVTKALADCRAAVEGVVAHGAPYSWENLCQPLAEATMFCSGVDMGRNIFQSENPVAMIKAVHAVVHHNETAERAYELFLSE
ncbi:hypothetical protein MJN69_26745, partial [Salmonella enterica subsp. enterica serovar Kentucky]|nr:hypothetical protein [Salmonella enterica subsp. enterica serovar Kentucky]